MNRYSIWNQDLLQPSLFIIDTWEHINLEAYTYCRKGNNVAFSKTLQTKLADLMGKQPKKVW